MSGKRQLAIVTLIKLNAHIALKKELILNAQNPLVKKLLKSESPQEAKTLSSYLQKLIALSQNLLQPQEVGAFIEEASLIFEPQQEQVEIL